MKQNIFTWSDDLVYTRGRHSLKFGFLFNHYQWYVSNFTQIKGNVTFPNLTGFDGQFSSFSGNDPNVPAYFYGTTISTVGFYVRTTGELHPG